MKRLMQRILWAIRRRILARWPGLPHSRHPLVVWMRRAWRWLMQPRHPRPLPLPPNAQRPMPLPEPASLSLPALSWAQTLELKRLSAAADRIRDRLASHRGSP